MCTPFNLPKLWSPAYGLGKRPGAGSPAFVEHRRKEDQTAV